MWSFLIWVKQLIVSAVLAWAGVNLVAPPAIEWVPASEQRESMPRACEARQIVIIQPHSDPTKPIRARVKTCSVTSEVTRINSAH